MRSLFVIGLLLILSGCGEMPNIGNVDAHFNHCGVGAGFNAFGPGMEGVKDCPAHDGDTRRDLPGPDYAVKEYGPRGEAPPGSYSCVVNGVAGHCLDHQ